MDLFSQTNSLLITRGHFNKYSTLTSTIDAVVTQAIADLGWAQPTLIQEKAIPLALEGKDILARARTGSGKTAAYAVPVIQHILASKQVCQPQKDAFELCKIQCFLWEIVHQKPCQRNDKTQ